MPLSVVFLFCFYASHCGERILRPAAQGRTTVYNAIKGTLGLRSVHRDKNVLCSNYTVDLAISLHQAGVIKIEIMPQNKNEIVYILDLGHVR